MHEPQDLEATLRGTSDHFFLALDELGKLEHEKRATEPGDPGFIPLSRDVRVAAETVLRIAIEQERIAEAVTVTDAIGELDAIEDVRPMESLSVILEEWRAVERALDAAPAGSNEARELLERFAGLRERYSRALKSVRDRNGL